MQAKEISDVEESVKQVAGWKRLNLAKAKLKASSKTSALFAGFAMVSMVEVSLEGDIPPSIMMTFSICTTLLVVTHLLALMISTCILPFIEAASAWESPQTLRESPHDAMHLYIEMSWIFSTGIGILLFMAEMGVLIWVRFHTFQTTGNYKYTITSMVILGPAILVFIGFSLMFYRKLVGYRYEQTNTGLLELERMARDLDVAKGYNPQYKSPHVV